jgi:hypothetical protein
MLKAVDITGETFGRLTVVSAASSVRNKNGVTIRMWLCRCECGNQAVVRGNNLRSGTSTSCGCRAGDDLSGKEFGRWLVIGKQPNRLRRPSGSSYRVWLCRCDCGGEKEIDGWALSSGKSRSCGCLAREVAAEQCVRLKTTHGKSSSPEYSAWSVMVGRCTNPSNRQYADYGGRGVNVCSDWIGPGGFQQFLEYMRERPNATSSLERKDNDRGYEPGNVEWSTSKKQARNRRSSVLLTYNGKTQCATDWALEVGLSPEIVRRRIRDLGWSVDRALTEPPKSSNSSLTEMDRLRQVYAGLKTRCLNSNDPAYTNYGARGISVCDRWLGRGGFDRFLADVGPRPSPDHSLDRKNNDGNYEPGNVQWATRIEQANNRRGSVTYGGRTLSLKQWSREVGLPYERVQKRVRVLGWPPLSALGLEPRHGLV